LQNLPSFANHLTKLIRIEVGGLVGYIDTATVKDGAFLGNSIAGNGGTLDKNYYYGDLNGA